jgi:uncharacterized cysteine cluster protein YcgN (CxxCxxCC family)
MKISPFWLEKPLTELTRNEWESLCDHCAKCCLHKIEDIDTREIHFTNVCCRFLDQQTCRCTEYKDRSVRVPDCVTLTPDDLIDPYWLPSTCSYRLIAENKPLPDWHPLLTGNCESTCEAGQQICGRVISETEADKLEQHLITWVQA